MKIAKKVIAILIIIMIIAGIFITVKKGINTGLVYTEREQMGIMLGCQFEVSDIKNIASKVFENERYEIQKATIFEDTVIIQSKEISDDQKQKLVESINEKYNLEVKTEEVEIEKIGAVDFKQNLKKYILPVCLTLVLIVIYFSLRFKKIGAIRTIIRFVTTLIMIELIYISVLGISQIEIGRLFAPVGFMLYMLSVVASTVVFEKERTELILSENNK